MDILMYKDESADVILEIGPDESISLKFRPYAFKFLIDIKAKFEVILYSSLNYRYLNPIKNYIEKQGKFFAYCLDESYCLFANVFSGIKCLDFLCENRKLENIVVVDSSVKSFPLNYYNIIPYTFSLKENQLIKISKVLDSLVGQTDIQFIIRKYIESEY